MFTDKEILAKLGMALYLHKGQIKRAEKAREAVEYLADRGVFDGRKVKVSIHAPNLCGS